MERPRLLSVDDDPAILRIICRVAGELGFETEALSASHRFMTAYVRLKPHIVTLDILMPDVDGIELIRWLDDTGSNASIVLISGGQPWLAKASKKLAEARGKLRISVLNKPFETSHLRDVLSHAAQAAGAAPAPAAVSF